jgi:3-oxoacyl-[acyl-carrier-protein] synthase-1/3-oxoacyl-[acyl-carrier-protein] synthase II
MSAQVVAIGAVSALGRGQAAYGGGSAGAIAASAIAHDEALATLGLLRPQCARAGRQHDDEDHATVLLGDALAQVVDGLDAADPAWRALRVGVAVGTSSGGMIGAERFFSSLHRGSAIDPSQARRATYFAPLDDALAGLAVHKRCQVLAACASSTIAIGLGLRWLERDACDLVIAGGYDAVSGFVAAGFEALRATSASKPRPFRVGRDGMALGEGAALVAMRRGARGLFAITGFGASADAVHITAPDREGAGLVRAAEAALGDAGCDHARIDVVSAHGTATAFNDAAEARAIGALFASRAPTVHAFKAQIGHALGAAGVLELLAVADALRTQVAPATAGAGELDPDAAVTLLTHAAPRRLDAALKLSAAFGGVTAALVVEQEADEAPCRSARPVEVVAWAAIDDVDRVTLAALTGVARDRLARIDELGQLALGAAAALVADVGRDALAGAGVVAGYGLATLDTNMRYYTRLLDKGARRVDPRAFPGTTPNAGAGHVAIVYGLTGPCFATNSGLGGALEALAAAAELVAAGDAERMLVIAADDDGPAARAWLEAVAPERPHARGAVAVLIARAGDGSTRRRVDPDLPICHSECAVGQLALRAWLGR